MTTETGDDGHPPSASIYKRLRYQRGHETGAKCVSIRILLTDSPMPEKFGHFKVTKKGAQILVLERQSELPVVLGTIGGVFIVLAWFLRAWHSSSRLIVWLGMFGLALPGILAVLYLRPWKEVLILDRGAGQLSRNRRYLLRRTKVTHVPLDPMATVNPVQRTLRVTDKKGQLVDHVYWAALLRSASGEEIELDGANAAPRMHEFAEMVNDFLAGSEGSPHN